MAEIPHFRIPFQVIGGTIATVEQDSDEDILTCVETVLRTPAGSRIEQPDFGVEELAFQTGQDIETECLAAIEECEPRAEAIPEATITNMIANVQIGIADA